MTITNEPFNDTELNAHLDTVALTHAINDQAYIRHEAAAHLAAKAVEDGYTGGQVIAGTGDYGLSTTLYIVIYPAGGMFHAWTGYRLPDGSWITLDCVQHRDLKSLRWMMAFNHNATLYDVNPVSIEAVTS